MISAEKRKDCSFPRKSHLSRKPSWLKVRRPTHPNYFVVSDVLSRRGLQTICENARCPNATECWSQKTATFLILGRTCTRECAFCAVGKGVPEPPRPEEPAELAEAAAALGLGYVVVTSVTRDDLPDGGAGHFAETVRALRRKDQAIKVEVLVPDFGGDGSALETVLAAEPDILNHNLETAEALYPAIRRPAAHYRRSLGVLRRAGELGATTKSGLMVGLGESREDIARTLADLRTAGCGLLTVGQYLQPGRSAPPVVRYYEPDEFEELKALALDLGFREVVAGPLVRSSYHARRLFDSQRQRN